MAKMAKLTFHVKLGEGGSTVRKQRILNLIRATVELYDGTFDLFHVDKTDTDKIEIAFSGYDSLSDFMHTDAYSMISGLNPVSGTYPLK